MNDEFFDRDWVGDGYAGKPGLSFDELPYALDVESARGLLLLVGSLDVLRKGETRRGPRVYTAAVRYAKLLDRALTRLVEAY